MAQPEQKNAMSSLFILNALTFRADRKFTGIVKLPLFGTFFVL
jgi:hypothetical protein